ncbi:hypothetical protein HY573_02410 [Candidatus Parcubacteria bacterium]|nr:hypothetical protein [Candidatus Parcubacteria bacterium]
MRRDFIQFAVLCIFAVIAGYLTARLIFPDAAPTINWAAIGRIVFVMIAIAVIFVAARMLLQRIHLIRRRAPRPRMLRIPAIRMPHLPAVGMPRFPRIGIPHIRLPRLRGRNPRDILLAILGLAVLVIIALLALINWKLLAVVAVIALVIYFMPRRITARWAFAFLTNNNVQWFTFLGIAVIWLLLNLFAVGAGDPFPPSPISEDAQRYYNIYFRGAYASNTELDRIGTFLGNTRRTIWSWSWRGWWLWLVFCFSYMFVAFRDEAGMAWDSAWRRHRERRGGEEGRNLPPLAGQAAPQPQPQPQPPEQPVGRRFFLFWELISDFASAFLSHLWTGWRERRAP